jgi:hypothetical protein
MPSGEVIRIALPNVETDPLSASAAIKFARHGICAYLAIPCAPEPTHG